ncbi:MAG: bifunctional protein-serine/threonine kinase/phosphatase [Gammaproteobacteria bacterium]|nr:bifunctional protein-serine/threonine kinase/phosphatase [Gammaproteobacteria bacterium]
MTSSLTVSIGQCSDKGIKPENQDFYGVVTPKEPLLSNKGIIAAIADGVSSSEAGKQASEACVTGLLSDYLSTPESWTVKTSGQKILSALNSWLYGKGQHIESGMPSMVTTLSAIVFKSTTAHIFHVGDSRVYKLQDNNLECLTNDHRVWVSNEKNYLNRAMGIDIHLDIDYRSIALDAGDIFILTTDGVHDYLGDKKIASLLLDNVSNLERSSQEIISTALANGSQDNLTCQIIRIDSLPDLAANDVYKSLTQKPFPPDLEKDQILDGYRITSEIHSSKRTQVYKAIDVESGKTVVLKTPSVNFEDNPAYIESFVREEWIGKRLNNKHIVKIYGADRPRQFLYYVTEYVNGPTLRQWMKEHPQPDIKEARELIKQIAAGLRAFHRLEMLHQDLKPENVILSNDGTIKIVDFGSTKVAGIAEITTPIERIDLQGTRNYTAPEYLLGQPGSNRSDIFSLGIITYELLTGKHPYGNALGKSDHKVKPAKLQYQPSNHYNAMIPIWLDKAIQKAVNPAPKQRYELLSEFISDISKPNAAFLEESPIPLIERDPVKFWQSLCIMLVISNLLLLYFLL